MDKFVVQLTDGSFIGHSRPVATKKAAREFASTAYADKVMSNLQKIFPNNHSLKSFTIVKL